MSPLARILVGVGAAVSLALSVLIIMGGEAVRLDEPGLRIVWQLLQASIASCVALAGLWMVFGKRGGKPGPNQITVQINHRCFIVEVTHNNGKRFRITQP